MQDTIFIPDNEYGIKEGYYTWRELVNLLRQNKSTLEAIQFIADMME